MNICEILVFGHNNLNYTTLHKSPSLDKKKLHLQTENTVAFFSI
jgi:hypothetical protein